MEEQTVDIDLKQNQRFQYPQTQVQGTKKKDFIGKLFQIMEYQKSNPQEIQKSALMEQDASGKRIFKLQISNQLFNKCKFYTSTIISCVFNKCIFIGCDFTGADLLNVKFNQCQFRSACNFSDCKMQDVIATDCIKSDCLFTNVDFSQNVQGFEEEDQSIIGQDVGADTFSTVAHCMEQYFQDWQQTDANCYQLTFQKDQNSGFAFYPNEQKNQDQQQHIWELTFFIGEESILMQDYDLAGKSEEEIKTIIDTWIKELPKHGETLVNRIVSILIQEDEDNE